MAVKVTMPKLGLTMTEGTIIEWKKKEGEPVEKGEILYILETEKVSFEVEAPESGTLGKIVAKEGDVVPVGGLVAYILQPGERLSDIPELAVAAEATEEAKAPAETGRTSAEKAKKIEIPGEIRISPLARKIAQEHSINVATLKGSGPGGRIVKEDVLKAVEEGKAAPVTPAAVKPSVKEELPMEEVKPLSSMRKVIAKRMVESFQSAPHFYLTVEVDTKELGETRQKLIPMVEAKTGIRLTFTDLLMKIVARALEEVPEVNCSYIGESVKVFRRVDIGMVTAVEGGLIVPVIRRANKLSLIEISKLRFELSEKARELKLSLDEMTGSTFTISNLGMFGIDQFSAIIQPPEGAILAAGRIVDKPVALNGEVVIRPRMTLTLSIDHRVLDGSIAARFLQRIKEIIENPVLLAL